MTNKDEIIIPPMEFGIGDPLPLPCIGDIVTIGDVLSISDAMKWTDIINAARNGNFDEFHSSFIFIGKGFFNCAENEKSKLLALMRHKFRYFFGGSEKDKFLCDLRLARGIAESNNDVTLAYEMFNDVYHLGCLNRFPGPWGFGIKK